MSPDLGQQILSMDLSPLDLGTKHTKITGFGSTGEQNYGAKNVPSFYNQLLKDSAREMHSNKLVYNCYFFIKMI